MKEILRRAKWLCQYLWSCIRLVCTGKIWEYRRIPVSMDQFLDDPYYLGTTLRINRPDLREKLKRSWASRGRELVVAGEIGSGKTTFMRVLMLRLIYEYSCWKDPRRMLGLCPDTIVDIPILDISIGLSKRMMVDELVRLAQESQYFKKNFMVVYRSGEVMFPGGLRVMSTSYRCDHALEGINIWSAMLMQSNDGGSFEQAEKIRGEYQYIVQNHVARFGKMGCGLIILQGPWEQEAASLSPWADDPKARQGVYLMWRQ